jgi:hypothetical protein
VPPRAPVLIPFPLSSFPGRNPQESEGRLVNCYVVDLGDGKKFKWVRSAGLSQFAATSNAGYRGGLTVNNTAYESWTNNASTVDGSGTITSIGSFPGTKPISIARNQAAPVPDVVAVDLDNGAYVLGSATVLPATATVTLAGSPYNSSDVVTLDFLNPYLSPPFPITISHTLGGSESASTVASALNTAINANATLAANHLTSTVLGAVLTISHQGSIGNTTTVVAAITGAETVTFSPTSGNLAGGQGTYGAFVGGIPTNYTGNGILPEPNSICFQDGYFFFTVGSGTVYATVLNSLAINALTYVTIQAKSDVSLLRGVAFAGVLLFFTTGSCEVWQDAGNPPPSFPYSRLAVLEFGLVQPTAIAGFEIGFSELLWVAQDFAVHWMTAGQYGQVKASPNDLDRLIETEIRSGHTLKAGAYIVKGKKFWVLSSPNWTWEINLHTRKWTERWSLTSAGSYGAWRGVGGHPGFGKWLVGDGQSGNLLWVDDTNRSENGTPMLYRIESGPVGKFPAQERIARADFDFVFGVGEAVAADGGVASDNLRNPMVAVSVSKDSGLSWGNPLLRPLGAQAQALRGRVSVLNQGLSRPGGVRWRLDVTDPVYVSLMGGTMSSEPRYPGV